MKQYDVAESGSEVVVAGIQPEKFPSRRLQRFCLAILLPFLAAALQKLFWEKIPYVAFFLFFPAVFFSGWLGGRTGGMVATLLSVGLVKWFFMEPLHTLVPDNPMQGAVMAVFTGVGFLIAHVHHHLESRTNELVAAQARAETALQQLARSEARSRQSEERLRLAVEGARLGTWHWDIATNEVTASDIYCAQFGLPPGAVTTYEEVVSLLHPADREQMAQAVRQAIEEQSDYQVEYRVLVPDGSVRWIAARGRAYYGKDGPPLRLEGVTIDITTRKQAETRIRESERRFRELFEYLPLAYQSLDSQGRYIDANQRLADLLGLDSPKEVLGRLFGDFWDTERNGGFDHTFAEFKAKQSTRRELTLRRRDGESTTVMLAGRIQSDTEGRFLRTHCILVDITERRAMEEEIRRLNTDLERKVEERTRELGISEERYRLIYEHAADAIIITDTANHVISVNEQACRQYGYEREEFLNLRVSDIDTPEDAAHFPGRLALVARDGRASFEAVHRDATGRVIPVDVMVAKMMFDGKPCAMSICRDITERKKYERELEEARRAADVANRAKSEFLANMSHEIRTPMNGIMGMAQLLEYTRLTAEQREYLDAIRSSSESLLSLINDVLDLSRIESGKIELEHRDFSLRVSISDVIKTQISLVHGKGLTMEVDIPAAVPDNLTGDQLRLKQILLNLLGNAIKFTAQGGIRITVAVSERHGDVATLQIGVTDSGIGISSEAIRKIFDPFVQADSSTTRQFGGTGLGLAICTRLTELMGGRIWAESSEGSGSTFFLQLPFAVNEAVVAHRYPRSSDKAPPRWDGPPLRILLVDDQEINLAFAARILQRAGHSIDQARDGREALDKWERDPFDLILMDVQMPIMGGVEATQAIRERERSSGGHIPIIAVTARALHDERKQIQSQGFDGYVVKPFELGELFGEMKRCLGSGAGQEL